MPRRLRGAARVSPRRGADPARSPMAFRGPFPGTHACGSRACPWARLASLSREASLQPLGERAGARGWYQRVFCQRETSI